MIQVAFYVPVSFILDFSTFSTNHEVLWILQPFRTGPRTSGSCIRVSCPIATERNVYSKKDRLGTHKATSGSDLPKMMDMLMKNLLSGLQFVGKSLAEGIPQFDGFGAPARMSCGIAAR